MKNWFQSLLFTKNATCIATQRKRQAADIQRSTHLRRSAKIYESKQAEITNGAIANGAIQVHHQQLSTSSTIELRKNKRLLEAFVNSDETELLFPPEMRAFERSALNGVGGGAPFDCP